MEYFFIKLGIPQKMTVLLLCCCFSEPCRSLLHEDGTRQLWFPTGNTLKISPDGLTRRVVFYNGDIQETSAKDGVVRYFYAETRAWHDTFSDGTQTITFPE
jgi:centromere protein J